MYMLTCIHACLQVNEYPDYVYMLLQLRKELTMEKEKSLESIQTWINESAAVTLDAYISRQSAINVQFGKILESPLLDPPPNGATSLVANEKISSNEVAQILVIEDES